jgi:hypothetical protein
VEDNNCNRHIYLYTKHWYKRTDIIEDLKLICAERCGNYNPKYINVNNTREVNECKVSSSDTLTVILNIVEKYIKADTSNRFFIDFINDIAPWNTWKVGYLNKQCKIWWRDYEEKEKASEYDYTRSVLHKCCSVLSMLDISKIKEIDNCELGEPDYKLFPMFKDEDLIQRGLVDTNGKKTC